MKYPDDVYVSFLGHPLILFRTLLEVWFHTRITFNLDIPFSDSLPDEPLSFSDYFSCERLVSDTDKDSRRRWSSGRGSPGILEVLTVFGQQLPDLDLKISVIGGTRDPDCAIISGQWSRVRMTRGRFRKGGNYRQIKRYRINRRIPQFAWGSKRMALVRF